jgi:hypothetical protein
MRSAIAMAAASSGAQSKVNEVPEKNGSKMSMDKDKGKVEGKDENVVMDSGATRRRRRRRRKPTCGSALSGPLAPEASATDDAIEFDDAWADTPMQSPPLVEVTSVAKPRRTLRARGSGSRSPRRSSPGEATDASTKLVAGRLALIQGLKSRPELDDCLTELKSYDAAAGRWTCLMSDAEQLRIVPDKLLPIEESHQVFQRLRYNAG